MSDAKYCGHCGTKLQEYKSFEDFCFDTGRKCFAVSLTCPKRYGEAKFLWFTWSVVNLDHMKTLPIGYIYEERAADAR